MRYGKVYYYDRMGNRHGNDPMVPKDDILIKGFFHSPQKANIRITEGSDRSMTGSDVPINLKSSLAAFHEDYPFKPNYLAYEESAMDFMEGGVPQTKSINNMFSVGNSNSSSPPNTMKRTTSEDKLPYRQIMGNIMDVNDEFNCSSPKAIIPVVPIMSPLNSLRSRTDSNVGENDRFAQELERIALNDEKSIDIAESDALILSRDWSSKIEQNLKQFSDYDTSSLCSHCLAEQTSQIESQRALSLKKKLVDHVDELNHISMNSREPEVEHTMSEFPRLEGLTEEETRAKEKLEKLRYRQELKSVIDQKQQEQLHNEEREKQSESAANTLDAKLFAEEKDRQKALEIIEKKRHYDELTEQIHVRDMFKREEEAQLEWWERRPHFSKTLNEEGDHIIGQLRRNYALKESVDELEDFKKQQQDQDEDMRSIKQQHQGILSRSIHEQAEYIKPDFGERRRRLAVEQNPEVFRAWEYAHLQNDRKYRILQETEGTVIRSSHHQEPSISTIIHQKHCRRCQRPLRHKKVTRFMI